MRDEPADARHGLCESLGSGSAKVEALARGKESFDLEKLEALVDPGRMIGSDERQRTCEYMYYVEHPKLTTLQELAEVIRVVSEY